MAHAAPITALLTALVTDDAAASRAGGVGVVGEQRGDGGAADRVNVGARRDDLFSADTGRQRSE
jgi:hypothetical protein